MIVFAKFEPLKIVFSGGKLEDVMFYALQGLNLSVIFEKYFLEMAKYFTCISFIWNVLSLIMNKLLAFIKKDVVLCVSFVLAVVSCFFVHPDETYISYIDFRVLGILLSLMIAVAGLRKANIFDLTGAFLLSKTNSSLGLCAVLTFLCFFLSMFITNDVALITFVPFAILTLKKSDKENLILPTVILQTLAANLGSMLTPVGNPQNLYLYNKMGVSFGAFVKIILPYALASFVMLVLCVIFCGRKFRSESSGGADENKRIIIGRKDAAVHGIFFVLALLTVLHVLPWYVPLGIIVLYCLIFDRKLLLGADYALLLTFIFFFVFTGNISRIEFVHDFFNSIVGGNEFASGVIVSQIISNVPAALLLSTFTKNFENLLIGVNAGGLGTLIASMASLISFKIFASNYSGQKGKYFLWFTVMNVAYLAVLVVVYILLG